MVSWGWKPGISQTRRDARSGTDVRWNGFVDWAVFLGMGWTASGGLLVDTTEALRTPIGQMFDPGVETASKDFVQRLAEGMPVLDGGSFRGTCIESFPDRYARDPDTVSASLSHAIKRLELMNVLKLVHHDDSPSAIILTPIRRSVTHIRLSQQSDA